MLSAGENCLGKNEIIERTWINVMLNWINKCVKSNIIVSELNELCFSEITKKYEMDIYTDKYEKISLRDQDIDTFLRKYYPKLSSEMPKSYSRAKKLYIAMSAVLYHFCTKDKSGKITADIFEKLDKADMEMILHVCEGLRLLKITPVNVEFAIKDAYDDIYMKTITKDCSEIELVEKKVQPIPDKEIRGMEPFKDQPNKRKLAVKSMTSLVDLKNKENIKSKNERSLDAMSYIELTTIDKPLCNRRSEDVIKIPRCKDNTDSWRRMQCAVSDDDDLLDMSVSPQESYSQCKPNCIRSKCSRSNPYCNNKGYSTQSSDSDTSCRRQQQSKDSCGELRRRCDKKLYCALCGMIVLAVLIVILCSFSLRNHIVKTDEDDEPMKEKIKEKPEPARPAKRLDSRSRSDNVNWGWQCIDQFCVKSHVDINITIYKSLSRCTLLCMGPQLWPYPIGYTHFSEQIEALTTTGMEYKFQSVPSELVHTYLNEAFKLFLKGLFILEKIDNKQNKSRTTDLMIKRISFIIEVEHDPDPRLRLNTDESYMLNFETIGGRVIIKVISGSFCGVRHALETTSQLILLDQATGYLLSYSDLTIKDAPSYRYRGLMLDTGRNYIPVTDIMRTIDAMASCKLNTLHWRISSETSFPLYLPQLHLLLEYGAYDRTMIYTKSDVKSIVSRAVLRGIRVLIEVTAPGPVGRAWSWTSEATCPKKTDNYTCDNMLCTRLLMEKSVFDALQFIYTEILQMTEVDDVFHLSDGMFSLTNCYQLISDRDGFLERALERLKLANKGVLPKLPIIWYTPHLMKDSEAKAWDRMGVQLDQWDPNPGEQFLGKFRVIHSTKWDLSCEISKHRCVKFRTWQEMYSWKSWRSIEVFTIEGGEAILWTDLVGPGNLDTTLWPRAAAVAERLWSDTAANSTANRHVYVRLDTHRWRMLLRGIKVQPIWPAWCSFNPSECSAKILK